MSPYFAQLWISFRGQMLHNGAAEPLPCSEKFQESNNVHLSQDNTKMLKCQWVLSFGKFFALCPYACYLQSIPFFPNDKVQCLIQEN